MEFNKNWIKEFKTEQLKISPKEWREDHQSAKDFGELLNETLLAKYNEQEIIGHFMSFNVETIEAFDNLVYYLNDKNELTLENVFNYFKVKEEIYPHNYDNEFEMMDELNEMKAGVINDLIGLFRWSILTEEYEYAILMERLIDQIDDKVIEPIFEHL